MPKRRQFRPARPLLNSKSGFLAEADAERGKMSELTKVDLSNCDREPIRIPGRIQPHGALLAFSSAEATIRFASLNALDFLGMEASSLIGKSIDEVFGRDFLKRVNEGNPAKIHFDVRGEKVLFDVIQHASGSHPRTDPPRVRASAG